MRSLRPDPDRRTGIADRGPAGFLVHVDGSSLGNPGPAGIGVRVLDSSSRVVKEVSRFVGIRTNNQAEYEALVCALGECRRLGPGPVVVRTDSELLYYQMAGSYRVKNPELRVLYSKARELALALPYVSIELVRREQNKETDKLARTAAHTAGDQPRHARK